MHNLIRRRKKKIDKGINTKVTLESKYYEICDVNGAEIKEEKLHKKGKQE